MTMDASHSNITYGTAADTAPDELVRFYQRMRHDVVARPDQIERMMAASAAFVIARRDGELIGLARGVCDGLRGYLAECKLDPAYQGPAAVTGKDGRIEHDAHGIAAEMAQRVLQTMFAAGARRIDVLAWGTEVDFCEELGFKRQGGLVGLTMKAQDQTASG